MRIKDDGKRAADIIAGLKAFYRKDGSPQRVLLDVNEVVREMLVLLHREADRHSVDDADGVRAGSALGACRSGAAAAGAHEPDGQRHRGDGRSRR